MAEAEAKTWTTRAFAQACAQCHSRKIKCSIPGGNGNSSCQTCDENGVKCRLRRPKKLGRPRQAWQQPYEKECPKRSLKWLPPRILQGTPPFDAAPSSANGPVSPTDPSEVSNTLPEAAEPPFLFLPRSAAHPRQRHEESNESRHSIWNNSVHRSVAHLPCTQPSHRYGREAHRPKGVLDVSDADISTTNVSLEAMFVHPATPSGPSFHTLLSLFTSYLEACEFLAALRSRPHKLSISELEDDHGAFNVVTRIGMLGSQIANVQLTPCPESHSQCYLHLAFLAAVKGCELAEQISVGVIPTLWARSHAEQQSIEHIAVLVRLDGQLSQLYATMSKLVQALPEQVPLAIVLTAKYRKRLSYLHTQIRGAVDLMLPEWE